MTIATLPSVAVVATPGFEFVVIGSGRPIVTVQVSGEMDIVAGRRLDVVVADELEQGCAQIRLDTSRVHFLDCAALGAILRAHHRCRAAQGALLLTGVSPVVRWLLHLTRLDDALTVVNGALPTPPPNTVEFRGDSAVRRLRS